MPIISRYYSQGEISENPILKVRANSRALRYGDGLFETILFAAGSPVALEYHFSRMLKGMDILGFAFDHDKFRKQIVAALEQLTFSQSATAHGRIRISVYRNGGGTYLPEDDQPDFWMEIHPLSADRQLSSLTIGLAKRFTLTYSELSAVKSMNALPYILAARQAKQEGWDEAILLNQAGSVAECTASNIFVVTDGSIKTPALTSGCLPGTMRARILESCEKLGIKIEEVDFSPSTYATASEVFISNAISGIRNVKRIVDSPFSANDFPLSDALRADFPYFY